MEHISWKYLFSSQILKRGEEYWREKRIIPQLGNDYLDTKTFYALGNEKYIVKIKRDDDSIKSMQCDCPYAMEGRFCKHMAGALFQLEDSNQLEVRRGKKAKKTAAKSAKEGKSALAKQKSNATVRVYPFADEQEQESQNGERPYKFYDLDKATREYPIFGNKFDAALNLIMTDKVRLLGLKEGFLRNGYTGMERFCVAEGKFKEGEGVSWDLRVTFTRDSILRINCEMPGCPQFRNYYQSYYSSRESNFCAHTLALLLLADDCIKQKHIGDATDLKGTKLMEGCRARRATSRLMNATAKEEKGHIRIEPRLDVETGGVFHLVFRVGREKLFVLKNLTEFVNSVEAHEEIKLGTTQTISFATDSLDEESQGFYKLIKKEVKMVEKRNEELSQKYMHSFNELKGYIPLYGRALDDFFNLMQGKRLPYTDKSGPKKVSGEAGCIVKSVPVKLNIKSHYDNDKFEGIELSGHLPRLVDGTDYKYFFDGENLNRADDTNIDLLESMRSYDASEEIEVVIGRRNLSEFYYRLLPILKEFADVEIEDSDEIVKYLYPEPEFSFYLDVEDGMLTCEPKVSYGGNGAVPAGARISNYREAEAQNPKPEVYEEYRDIALERETMETVLNYFPYGDGSGMLYSSEEEEQQYRILESGVDALIGLGAVHATDRFHNITIRRKPQMTVGVRMESDLLKLSISSTDLSEDELLDILGSYRKTKKYHRLKNGDFVQLDESTMEELENLMELTKADLKDFVKGDMEVPAYRALYLDKVLEKNDVFYAKRDRNFKQLVKEFKTVSDSEYEIPESLQGVMRNYQEFGYKWLRTVESYRFGGILADDMGLGKTLQLISILLAAKEEGRLGSALVVTPASLVYNWKEEFAKFAPQLSVAVIAGTKGEREAQIKDAEAADVLITSYDLLKRDILFYADKTFDYQIIDEAQSIKTHTTAAAKAVKAVNSRIRFALTGTPIENRLSELWSIFDFLMPGFLYSYDRFRKEFEIPVSKHQDQAAMSRLKRFVEPFILRRLKQDVLSDLPEKTEEICYVQFEQKQQRLYDAQVLHIRKILDGESEEMFQKNKIALLAEITKTRQICCDPALCFSNYDGESAKREACLELLQNAIDGGHKILVFSQFRSLLELLEGDLRKEGLAYFKITGETKKEDRVEMVKRFNADDTPIFLISLKAGGTGLNLTGADIVIHLDPWWNIAAQDQATDRAHRIGQTKAVSVYKIIAKNTMEEKILKMQEQKRALADEILSGNTGGLLSMSKDELLELL